VQGVDNQSYYRLMPDDRGHYRDLTGTGKLANPCNPSVLRISWIVRYFVTEKRAPSNGVSASISAVRCARVLRVRPPLGVFDTIPQDPVLSQVKLIAGAMGGRRARWLQSELSGALGGVERACIAT